MIRISGFVSWLGLGFVLAAALPAIAFAHTQPQKKSSERVVVDDVFLTSAGRHIVVLRTTLEPARYLPIQIAQREALAIQLRLERQAPPRPLTLNLTESILRSSESKLRSVSIDEVHGSLFLGKIRLEQKGRVWTLDARPSDAIALALGQDSPIWVAKKVLKEASFEVRLSEKGLRPAEGRQKEAPKPPVVISFEGSI